jgi:hypothetical protein
MENKIQSLLIESTQKLGTAISYEKTIRVDHDGTISTKYYIVYISGESESEYDAVCRSFDHSMEVVIYLESLINLIK